MADKTHWKKTMNPDYLGSWAIPEGQEISLTIKSASVEKVKGVGGKSELCNVVHFKESVKPLIANATNSKAISKVAGSPFLEDWAGHRIQLYATEVEAFGDVVDAVRVRSKAPAARERLSPEHPRWNGAVAALKKGETTIDSIKARFDLTLEDEALLAGEINA